MPDRGAAFLWSAEGSFLFDETGPGPAWTAIPGTPVGPADASVVHGLGGLAYTGDEVVGVRADGSGARYALATGVWSAVPAGSGFDSMRSGSNFPVGVLLGAEFANGLISSVQVGDFLDMPSAPSSIAYRLDPNATSPSWSRASMAVAYSDYGWTAPAWLAGGNAILYSGGLGGSPPSHRPAVLFDPRVSTMTSVASPPYNGGWRTGAPYSFYTGRAVILFGGTEWWQVSSSFESQSRPGGAIGVVEVDGVSWAALPSAGAPPSARSANLAANTQYLWTGREAFVYGGIYEWGFFNKTWLNGGSRYQPPVGCICPTNLDAPPWFASQCDGISKIADTTCSP
jgi:hypothetical protein